jgi:hypothetical protein
MLKSLHKDDTQTTPFVVTKNWELSNVANEDLILMEHSGSDGLPVALEYINYRLSSPITASGCNIALEQQKLDRALFKDGLKITGIFYPDSDPKNPDGTYQRCVYTQVVGMFYNNYRDPTKIWGLEELDFENSQTKRFIADKFKMFEIPQPVFGEKIIENTVTLFDTTTDNNYTITDDGKCNLFAGTNLFSHQQELGQYLNIFVTGSTNNCDYYNTLSIPNTPILSISNILYNPYLYLSWNVNDWPVSSYEIERSTNSITYTPYQSVVGLNFLDTNITSSVIYWYKIYAANLFGTSSFSNVVSASSGLVIWDNDPDIWDQNKNIGPTIWNV